MDTSTDDYTDWPTAVAHFRDLFPRTVRRRPAGITGENFMTPDVLGYVLTGSGVTVEISTGHGIPRGFGGDAPRIYGVTFPRLPDGSPDPRSGCFFGLHDVRDHVAQS